MNISKIETSVLSRSIRLGLLAGAAVGTAMIAAPVVAQDDATELDRIEVTGSRIKRTDIEGPLPVTVISREDIERAGDLNVGDVLRYSTFNTSGSFTQSSGFAGGAQGISEIDLRGLGSQRTLVLMDGRRIANSPGLGSASQNLNTIPLAAIERIEVLRDGASAVYGSDAIGGVVNIITRKDFQGLSISGTYTNPKEDGGDERFGSIVMGLASDRGNVMITLDHYEKDIIFYRDRDYLINTFTSTLGFPGSFLRRDPTTLAPVGLWEADARCPQSLDSDPNFPNSEREFFPGFGEFCMFRFASVSGFTAATDRDSLNVSFNYDITDNTSAFGRFSATRAEAFGRYAPAPAIFTAFIGATNPINPTLGELGPGQGYVLDLRFRFVPLGNRDSYTTDTVTDNVFGFRGNLDVIGGMDWEFAVIHSRYRQRELGYGYGLISNFFNAVAAGQFNPFGPPTTAANNLVAHTISDDNEFRRVGMDGRVNFDLFDLPAGPVGFAAGFEYYDDRFTAEADAQSNAGNVFGSAGGSASGERASSALFVEALFPLLDRLEMGVAVRHDRYNDFGNKTNPKVSLLWRPIDQLVLRGSYGKGFRAPSLQQLGDRGSQSFPGFVDQYGCFLQPDNAFRCTAQQREIFIGGNRNLQPETSTQYSFGVVWNILEDLSFGVDYYSIKLKNGIGAVPLAQIMANELRCRTGATPCIPELVNNVIRDANGEIVIVNVVPTNFSGITTTGWDADLRYALNTDIGRWGFGISVSQVRKFEFRTLTEIDLAGTAFFPKRRGTGVVSWSLGDFGATLNATHIGNSCEFEESDGSCGFRLGSWNVFDLSAHWNAPWNAEIQIGVRNIANRDPVLDSFGDFDPTATNAPFLYDMLGRVPYIRYTQNF
ncbi:MAG TPA: TonB-dependent receptor [Xanthomonadaceae bacterium]|nr:TonB-dependent receptor [Xanthomonadaceae bacterium]